MGDRFRRAKTPPHVRMFHSIMDTPAWIIGTSGSDVKVLLALVRKDNGSRNGQIAFSCREAAAATGLSERTCQRSLVRLQELGFIRCTQKGAFSRKVLHASLWRYTWQAWPEGKMGPTRDFEKWKPDGKTRVQKMLGTGAELSIDMETHPLSGDKYSAEEMENPLVSANRHSDRIATLTSYQGEPGSEPETEQRKRADPISRAFPARLRASLIAHLADADPGEQTRLAKTLGIPGGTLSKFINGKGLPVQHATSLASALLPAMETMQ